MPPESYNRLPLRDPLENTILQAMYPTEEPDPMDDYSFLREDKLSEGGGTHTTYGFQVFPHNVKNVPVKGNEAEAASHDFLTNNRTGKRISNPLQSEGGLIPLLPTGPLDFAAETLLTGYMMSENANPVLGIAGGLLSPLAYKGAKAGVKYVDKKGGEFLTRRAYNKQFDNMKQHIQMGDIPFKDVSEITPVGKNITGSETVPSEYAGLYVGHDSDGAKVISRMMDLAKKKNTPLWESVDDITKMVIEGEHYPANIGTKAYYKDNPLFKFMSYSLRDIMKGKGYSTPESLYSVILHEGRHFMQNKEGMRLLDLGQYNHPKLLKKNPYPVKSINRALEAQPSPVEMTTLIDIPKPKLRKTKEAEAKLVDAMHGGNESYRHLKYLSSDYEVEARVAQIAAGKGKRSKYMINYGKTQAEIDLGMSGFSQKQIEKMVIQYKKNESLMYFHGSTSVYDDPWKAGAKQRAKEQKNLDRMNDELIKKMTNKELEDLGESFMEQGI